MKGNTLISRLMTRTPLALGPDESARRAREVMLEHGVHHLPIVSDGRFVGLVSTNDLHRIALGDPYRDDPELVAQDLELFPLQEVMTEDVVTLQASATVRDAALQLAKGSFHAIPILNGDALAGIVTSTDLVAYLIEDE